ncbi:MAG: hypothetical protein ACRELF_15390 [Gemmataceae bacterium]
MPRFATIGVIALAVGMMASANAVAQTVSPDSPDGQAITTGVQHLESLATAPADALEGLAKGATSSNSLGGSSPISSGALDDATGGFSLTVGAVTDQTLTATTTNNQLTVGGNLTNGAVTVASGAFSGFSGISNYIANTGNQNVVQGALNVTIVMTPSLGSH